MHLGPEEEEQVRAVGRGRRQEDAVAEDVGRREAVYVEEQRGVRGGGGGGGGRGGGHQTQLQVDGRVEVGVTGNKRITVHMSNYRYE